MDLHRVVKEVVGSTYPGAKKREGPDELTLRVGKERRTLGWARL